MNMIAGQYHGAQERFMPLKLRSEPEENDHDISQKKIFIHISDGKNIFSLPRLGFHDEE